MESRINLLGYTLRFIWDYSLRAANVYSSQIQLGFGFYKSLPSFWWRFFRCQGIFEVPSLRMRPVVEEGRVYDDYYDLGLFGLGLTYIPVWQGMGREFLIDIYFYKGKIVLEIFFLRAQITIKL